jgi:hypothetical protein
MNSTLANEPTAQTCGFATRAALLQIMGNHRLTAGVDDRPQEMIGKWQKAGGSFVSTWLKSRVMQCCYAVNTSRKQNPT